MQLLSSQAALVSVHGGHSGEFCHHATDTLEAVLERYVELGFSWVGISEHVPAPALKYRYPDQIAAGLTPDFLYERFARYIAKCRALQAAFKPRLKVFLAIESESYSGYQGFMQGLIDDFKPDYIVGSVHHVKDYGFDYSFDQYWASADAVGGIDNMYCEYYDLQMEMLENFKPAVVGHFDLIRLYDPDYKARIKKDFIAKRISRNLEFIAKNNLILDYNLRALRKGGTEPYVSYDILNQAVDMGIDIVPGDDSHGVSQVGNFMKEGLEILEKAGVNMNWKMPRLYQYKENNTLF